MIRKLYYIQIFNFGVLYKFNPIIAAWVSIKYFFFKNIKKYTELVMYIQQFTLSW